MSYMTGLAARLDDFPDAPKLRLFAADEGSGVAGDSETAHERPSLRLLTGPAPTAHPVLVAGGDSAGRAEVVRNLSESMPASTTFAEAGTFWEVLVRAPNTSLVILSGELDELPGESLMQMLAHRHPGLAVVSLDAPAPPLRSPAFA